MVDEASDQGLSALRRVARLIDENRIEAERLADARRALIIDLHTAGYTQERLAECAAVSQPYIHRMIKQGKPESEIAKDEPGDDRLADLGKRLRVARERRDMTAVRLARAAEVTARTVNTVEAGGDIRLDDFVRIATALGKAEWLDELESIEPTPGERLDAILSGRPLPIDAGTWHARQLEP